MLVSRSDYLIEWANLPTCPKGIEGDSFMTQCNVNQDNVFKNNFIFSKSWLKEFGDKKFAEIEEVTKKKKIEIER